MRDCYIPDLTERFPEGFGGVDMYETRDREYELWLAVEEAMEYEEETVRELNEMLEKEAEQKVHH